jgi:hypothetical protein
MKPVHRQILSCLILPLGLLASCDSSTSAPATTGVVDETNHAATAVVYSNDGKPVPQALVQAFRRDDTTRKAAATVLTEANGSYALPTLENGVYRVIARKGALVAVQDSVLAVGGKTTAGSDTLEAAPTAQGVVKMIGDDNPASVLVQVQGTDVLVNVDKDGAFSLGTLTAGTYTLRLSTDIEGYTLTTRNIAIRRGQTTLLDTVAMNFTSVPPVSNFRATVDSSTNAIRLGWDLPVLKGVRDVLIRRVLKNSFDSAFVIGNSDSGSFLDAENAGTTASRTWLYTAQIRMLDGRLGRVAYITVNQLGGAPPTLQLGLVDALGRFDSSLGKTYGIHDTLRFRAVARAGRSPIAGINAMFFGRRSSVDTILKSDSSWILQWIVRLDSAPSSGVDTIFARASAWDIVGRSDSAAVLVTILGDTLQNADSATKRIDSTIPAMDSTHPVADSVKTNASIPEAAWTGKTASAPDILETQRHRIREEFALRPESLT